MSKFHKATRILILALAPVGVASLCLDTARAQATAVANSTSKPLAATTTKSATTAIKTTTKPAAKTTAAKTTAAKTTAAKTTAAKTTKVAKAGLGAGGAGGTGPTTKATASAGEDKDVAATEPPAASSPMADLKKSNDQLDKLLKKKHPTWSPEGEAQKAAVQKLVGGFLDYRELARRALAKHWDKLQPSQRQEFVTTLRALVERSYLKQVGGDPNYNIKYEKEEKSGSDATVDAVLNTVARGKKVKISLVYKLIHKDRWVVYDVVTDEQSMLENYRAEFNKIINKEGFDALLKRMKRKLEEKDE